MTFQAEKESISADRLLQALADRSEIRLSRCTITGPLDINRLLDPTEKFQTDELPLRKDSNTTALALAGPIVFDNCIFEENVVFTAPWSEPDSLEVQFETDVIFNSSEFKGQARFRNALFHGVAGFDGCTFHGVVTFKNASIHKDAKFRTAAFKGYALFSNVAFNGSARFTNTQFVKGANFSEVKFLGQTDFNGVYSSSRAVPACDSIFFAQRRYGDDESFWRFVKQSAQEAGHYHLAGECFYNERCAGLWRKFRGTGNYEALTPSKKLLHLIQTVRLLPELIFGRMLFGYGERPTRVLMASALIILLCTFFYAAPGMLASRDTPTQQSLLQGLYFSVITFTTLGYGDLYPAAGGLCRFVAMAEAVIGASLIALFVVCLAKRFSRG